MDLQGAGLRTNHIGGWAHCLTAAGFDSSLHVRKSIWPDGMSLAPGEGLALHTVEIDPDSAYDLRDDSSALDRMVFALTYRSSEGVHCRALISRQGQPRSCERINTLARLIRRQT